MCPKKLSDYFHVVLFTSLEPVFLRKIIHKIGWADKIMQIVYLGQPPEILLSYPVNINPNNILQIGDLNEFDWELKTDYQLDADEWLTPNGARKLINCTHEYITNNSNEPNVTELWQKLIASKSVVFKVL